LLVGPFEEGARQPLGHCLWWVLKYHRRRWLWEFSVMLEGLMPELSTRCICEICPELWVVSNWNCVDVTETLLECNGVSDSLNSTFWEVFTLNLRLDTGCIELFRGLPQWLPSKCWDSTSIKLQRLPSKSFHIHHSSAILPFDAMYST
jgi:hypothetical protein